jgi:hypothetical protein
MSRYFGDDITTAVKVPCAAPAVNDVMVIDPSDAKVGVFAPIKGKNVGTGEIGGKVISNKIGNSGNLLTNGHVSYLTGAESASELASGLAITTGTKNTHIQLSTSVIRSSKYSVQLMATGTAAAFETPLMPVIENRAYKLRMVIRSTSNTAGYTLDYSISYYDSDETTQVGSTTTGNYSFAAANTWYEFVQYYMVGSGGGVPVGARYAKISLAKTTNSHSIYIDTIELLPLAAMFQSNRAGSVVSISDSTWSQVTLNVVSRDTVNGFDVSSLFYYTCQTGGQYWVKGMAYLLALGSGKFLNCAIYVNGSAYKYGALSYSHAASTDVTAEVSALVPVSHGDTLAFWVYHNHGSARNIQFGSTLTYFDGVQVDTP